MSNDIQIERRLAAVFAADVAGYSRLMEADEPGTLRALQARRAIMDDLKYYFDNKVGSCTVRTLICVRNRFETRMAN